MVILNPCLTCQRIGSVFTGVHPTIRKMLSRQAFETVMINLSIHYNTYILFFFHQFNHVLHIHKCCLDHSITKIYQITSKRRNKKICRFDMPLYSGFLLELDNKCILGATYCWGDSVLEVWTLKGGFF